MSKYLDKEQIKNNLTLEDITTILVSLGSGYPKQDSDGNLIFQTVCHGGDSYKLYYYINSRTFFCFTHCEESFDIYELVLRSHRAKGTNFTFYEAVKYVVSITGNEFYTNGNTHSTSCKIDDWDWLNKFSHSKSHKPYSITPINENILDLFIEETPPDWNYDGITNEAMSYYGIKFCPSRNAYIIPHRYWKTGELIGVRGRYLKQSDVDNGMKYAPIQVEGKFLKHPLGMNFFGLYEAMNAIKRYKKVMIVESEKSVLQNYVFFQENNFAIALCGANLTDTQIKILLGLKLEEVILALDKEYVDHNSLVGQTYLAKLISKLSKLKPYMRCSILFDRQNLLNQKDSPTDRGKETLLKLLDDKITVTDEDLLMIQNGVKVNN